MILQGLSLVTWKHSHTPTTFVWGDSITIVSPNGGTYTRNYGPPELHILFSLACVRV